MTDLSVADLAPEPEPELTYSHESQSGFRCRLIQALELVLGRPGLERMYHDWRASGKRAGESVFDGALRFLGVTPQITGLEGLDLPGSGGVLVVANHPYGILDGLTVGHLGMRLRGSAHILTNSLLCKLPELEPHLLPVDFAPTPEARRLTSATRRRAVALLAAGECVVIFPAGGIATANDWLRGRAHDAPWHPFVARLATVPGVTVLPLHFPGQNSRLFQIASHLSYAMRVALIFHETRRRMGRPVAAILGKPIPAEALQGLSREAVTAELRRRCMALSPEPLDPDEVFRWPAHIRW